MTAKVHGLVDLLMLDLGPKVCVFLFVNYNYHNDPYFFFCPALLFRRGQLNSCQHRSKISVASNLAWSSQLDREANLGAVEACSLVAVITLDQIAAAGHLVCRMTMPVPTAEWSMVTDFTQEARKDVLAGPGQHVAPTLGAPQVRFV